MRLPTFARQSDSTTETEGRAPITGRTDPAPATQAGRPPAAESDRTAARAAGDKPAPPSHSPVRTAPPAPPTHSPARTDDRRGDSTTVNMDRVRETDTRPAPAPVVAGPKPRASLLATLGLITGVGGALLVFSGPLAGYGIGVAALALLLSLAGLRATRKRHIAGKTDALIGLALALGAIAVGVFALTGSFSWAGTDVQPVNNLREWLDAQFIDRF